MPPLSKNLKPLFRVLSTMMISLKAFMFLLGRRGSGEAWRLGPPLHFHGTHRFYPRLRKNQGYFQGPPIMGPLYGKFPILFPYLLGFLWDGMGIVWETYHKGVPLLGIPENPTEKNWRLKMRQLWKYRDTHQTHTIQGFEFWNHSDM